MPDIRAELSTKNKYWISKHRFYEIYHFCLQYNEWKDEYQSLDGLRAVDYNGMPSGVGNANPTAVLAERRAELRSKMELIEQTALEADGEICQYILKAVTNEGITCAYLKQVMGMPCERDMYYDRRRKFYWLMSQKIK